MVNSAQEYEPPGPAEQNGRLRDPAGQRRDFLRHYTVLVAQGLQHRLPIRQAIDPDPGSSRISLLDYGRQAERRTDAIRLHVDVHAGPDDVRALAEACKHRLHGRDVPGPGDTLEEGTDIPLPGKAHDRQADRACA